MQALTVGKNQAGQRFDKYLHKVMPTAGTGFIYKMLRKKNITLNGRKAEGSEIVAEGDTVRFFFSDETFEKFTGISAGKAPSEKFTSPDPCKEYRKAYQSLQGIQVIYEDENFCFLAKPAGILTQKAKQDDASLNEWLLGYLLSCDASWEKEFKVFHPSVCNRLDRNTSGLVLCGKSLAGSQYLSKCIKERTVKKFYRTICLGEIVTSAFINGFLIKDERTNTVRIEKHPLNPSQAEFIMTGYTPLKATRDYTHLEVELVTGKTHQIRAHLASIGHPLIGDTKYGSQTSNQKMQERYQLRHQLLHAYRVTFPVCTEGVGEALSGRTFLAEYPKQFQTILTDLVQSGDR